MCCIAPVRGNLSKHFDIVYIVSNVTKTFFSDNHINIHPIVL